MLKGENMVKVSLIIPIYNSQDYIARCLDSLLKQTLEDIEIVCINDGSTDKSLEILEEYSKKYSNIKVYSKENGGCGSARNMGIDNAEGEYIEFVDSDDILEQDAVEKMYKQAKKYNSDLVVCGMHRIDEQNGKLLTTDMMNVKLETINIEKNGLNNLLFINPGPCNKLHKKSIFKVARFPKIPVVDDLMLTLQYMPYIKNISFVREPLYKYKVRKESGVNTLNYSTYEQMKEMFIQIKQEYIKMGLEKEYLDYIDKMAYIHVGVSMLYRVGYIKEKSISKEIKMTIDYLNKEFSQWKQISKIKNVKLVPSKKVFMVKTVNRIYKMGLAEMFIKIYIFFITKLNIDIKW